MSVKSSARKMAVVAQHNYYNFDFTVREVVLMGRAPHKKTLERDNAKDYQIVDEALKTVQMETFADRTFSTLSGGEQQRVILARALAQQTPALILDEPTNHLDVASREWIECAIDDYEGTLIFVSHDRYFVEKFATRVWELENGTIRDFHCGYAKYRSIKEHEAMQRVPEKQEKAPKPVRQMPDKELQKLVRRLEREIAAQEDAVAALDRALEAASSDYQELVRLTAEREEAENKLEELMTQWETAASQIEE